MNMTNDEKNTNQRLMRRRYAELKSKKQKGALLDQFCAMTGLHRKSAIRSLSPKEKHHRKRGRPFQTGMGARTLLRRIWKQAGRPCAVLLKPVLALWLESLRRAGERLDETEVSDVLRMSARTIDRRLSGVRPRWSGRSRAASLAEHRRRIPLKVQTWPADAAAHPGWLEIDTVEHCGGSTAGEYNCSETMTDVPTQWTETRVSWTKRPEAVEQRVREGAACFPFPARGVNTDNGPDYINETLNRCFVEIFPGALRTRSRPYCKNDNAHVEQKNGHRARRIFGFGRYGDPETTEAMNEVARLQSLFDNLYRPTQKLLSKTKVGHKYSKVFEKEPKTPAQRVLESADVPEAGKARVRALLAQNDPLRLLRRIESAWEKLRRRQARLAARKGSPPASRRAEARRSAPPLRGRLPPAGTPARIGQDAAGGAASQARPPAPAKKHPFSVTPIMAQPRNQSRGFG